LWPLSRFEGCLLGAALGDALGAPFEGSGPGPKDLRPLRRREVLSWTDDTQMSIAVARALLEASQEVPGPQAFAQSYVRHFEPSRGYGAGATRTLGLLAQGMPAEEASRAVFPEGSAGNGAAMRAAPIGLCYHHDLGLLEQAVRNASVPTHPHPLGVEGARLQALAVALVLRGQDVLSGLLGAVRQRDFQQRLRLLKAFIQAGAEPFGTASQLGTGILALESVPTALYAFLRFAQEGYMKVVEFCLYLGGDTDTLASMAGALAGTALGREGLPEEYLSRLEARRELQALAQALCLRCAPGRP